MSVTRRFLVLAFLLVPSFTWAGQPPHFVHEVRRSGPSGFGETVALDGDFAVVGDPGSGAVILFSRNQGGADGWQQSATVSVVGGIDAAFGTTVALSGDTLVVGATRDDGDDRGAAFVFQRDVGGPDNWGQVKKLTASDGAEDDFFGSRVAIDGDIAVVAAAGDDSGSVYVFGRDEGGPDNWGELRKLAPTGTPLTFGDSVSVSGDTVAVGAPSAAGGGTSWGSVHVFDRDEGGVNNWGETRSFSAPSPADFDRIGRSVAISGDTILAGSVRSVVPGPVSGAAFVFERDQGGPDQWGFVRMIVSQDLDAGDLFSSHAGSSVALVGDLAVIGAITDEDLGPQFGAAYVFGRNVGGPDNWGQTQKITPTGQGNVSRVGVAVATDGEAVLLGSDGEDVWFYTPRRLSMFVTSADYAANFGRLAGADAICAAEATAGSVPGTWLAFLSALGNERFARLPVGRPLQRLDGASLAADSVALNGPIDHPLEVASDFSIAPAATRVWTGNLFVQGSCLDWTVAASLEGEYGLSSATTADWHRAGDDPCSATNRLYCFRFVCPGAPEPSCVDGFAKGTLQAKEAKAGKEKVKIDFKNGPAVVQNALGNPLTLGGTQYASCIYDDGGELVGELLVEGAGELCAGRPCWAPLGGLPPGGKGFLYKDSSLSSDGVQKLQLRAGSVGKSKISLTAKRNAKKEQNALPVGIAGRLVGSTTATVQLHASDAAPCFSVMLDDVRKSTSTFFFAKR